jgi:hypothetical protein
VYGIRKITWILPPDPTQKSFKKDGRTNFSCLRKHTFPRETKEAALIQKIAQTRLKPQETNRKQNRYNGFFHFLPTIRVLTLFGVQTPAQATFMVSHLTASRRGGFIISFIISSLYICDKRKINLR